MNYHRDADYLANEALFRNIFTKRFDLINKHLKNGKVLEIGCSNGVFLDLFKEAGWETWGVEPSETARSAQRKGHRVTKSNFEKVELPTNSFDLVVMNHVLEHMDQPATVLEKVFSVLKKDGFLFVDVPNAGGLGAKLLGKHWPYYLPHEHKHQFTRRSLTDLLWAAGFKVIYWESRSGLFEYANPWLELWQSLRGLKKRFLFDVLATPYSLLATLLNRGDSMTLLAQKK